MEILTATLPIGTHNMGFSAQVPAKKWSENLTPKKCVFPCSTADGENLVDHWA